VEQFTLNGRRPRDTLVGCCLCILLKRVVDDKPR
jgi:hypothetical protein